MCLHDNTDFTRSEIERSSKVLTTDRITTTIGAAYGYFLLSSDGSLIAYHWDSFGVGP